MFVKNIQEFTASLAKAKELEAFDQKLVEQLQGQFSARLGEEQLSPEDLALLKTVFQLRWLTVVDTSYDYMQNVREVNRLWIDLAKALADDYSSLTFIRLLCPTVKNSYDPNSFTLLADVSDLTQLYLGADNQSLYSYKGLFQHLIRLDHQLSTYSASNVKRLRAVSIQELSRIHRQAIGINKFKAKNIWSYLNSRVFPRLGDRGEIPVHLLSFLLELVNAYFAAQSGAFSFAEFRKQFLSWLKKLMKRPMADINAFYGAVLEVNQQEKYMLELLIAIYNAEGFTLAPHFLAIAQWLNQFNPLYVIEDGHKTPVCQALQDSQHGLRHEFTPLLASDYGFLSSREAEERCLLIFISLMSQSLQGLMPTTVEFWDISKKLNDRAGHIFSMILPMIEKDDFKTCRFIYIRIMEDYIKPAVEAKGFLSRMVSSQHLQLWYLNVKANKPLGFKYQLLDLQHILQFLFSLQGQPAVAELDVYALTDNVIRIGAQNHAERKKQIRANIEFVQFVHTLHAENRSQVLSLLTDFQYEPVKKDFFQQCISYSENRLNLIRQSGGKSFLSLWHKEPRAPFTWTPQLRLDMAKCSSLQELIMRLKQSLYKEELHLSVTEIEQMTDYLREIEQPILTPAEAREEAIRENQSDYFSAILEGNI